MTDPASPSPANQGAPRVADDTPTTDGTPAPGRSGLLDIFLTFLRLGCVSFGGPVAHLGYFQEALVRRRRWMSEAAYAELVALCQFLPGPASSQVGYAIGLMRGGWLGGVLAWIGFTLPSAAIMIAFAYGVGADPAASTAGWMQGLKIAAAAVVAHAVWSMARKLCPTLAHVAIALVVAVPLAVQPTALGQIVALLAAALAGVVLFRASVTGPANADALEDAELHLPLGRTSTRVALAGFFVLLLGLPLLAWAADDRALSMFADFYKAGALVFGGGHVVLPLLEAAMVPAYLNHNDFLAGYGAAQAVPGPLFSFSAYCGTYGPAPLNGWLGGLVMLAAIYLPSWLLVAGVLPLWNRIRTNRRLRAALAGANAGVVGLLGAAFYNPVLLSSVHDWAGLALGLALFAALQFLKAPSWAVVIAAALAGWAIWGA
ncbi:MAG: chromate efflux transporter [Verrucomicrobiota bacterium]